MAHILVVDDESNLRATLALILQKEGHSVSTAGHAQEARRALSAGAYDLAFLDLWLPDVDGLTLLAEFRQRYPDMDILILTGHGSLDSSIEAVRCRARDYLLKPVDPQFIRARVEEILSERRQPRRQREILAQIQTLLAELHEIERELGGQDAPPSPTLLASVPPTAETRFLRHGDLTLDLHARHVTLAGTFVPVPPAAFDYLLALAQRAPEPISSEELALQAQGYQVSRIEAQEIVRWHIHQLRQVLEPDPKNPRYIITVRGFGYRLAV